MYFLLTMISALHARLDDAKDRGATATEYAILITVVVAVIAVGAGYFGTDISNFFQGLATKIGLK